MEAPGPPQAAYKRKTVNTSVDGRNIYCGSSNALSKLCGRELGMIYLEDE